MNTCSNCGYTGEDVKKSNIILNDRTLYLCEDRPRCRLRELAKIKREAAERLTSYTLPDLPV
jgi:hypothetical protein